MYCIVKSINNAVASQALRYCVFFNKLLTVFLSCSVRPTKCLQQQSQKACRVAQSTMFSNGKGRKSEHSPQFLFANKSGHNAT